VGDRGEVASLQVAVRAAAVLKVRWQVEAWACRTSEVTAAVINSWFRDPAG